MVLVIEDDPVQRTLIVRAAENTGYQVVAVESCREAIEQLGTGRFSCLTLDLTLEDGDGFDVVWQMANAACRSRSSAERTRGRAASAGPG